jgi:hypothetical protein
MSRGGWNSPDRPEAGSEFQAGRNELQARRNQIQAKCNEIQIFRNKIQISFPDFQWVK